MSVKYESLFKPFKIGPVEISNRIAVLPIRPVVHNTAGEAFPDLDYMSFFTRRVRGGFGLIIAEGVAIHPFENVYTHDMTMCLYKPVHASAFKKVTDAVHAFGGKIFIQLCAGGFGRQFFDPQGIKHPLAASPIPVNIDPTQLATNIEKSVIAQNLHGQVPREITRSEIYDFIDAHFNGTMLAIQAGFDGVEVHCAHGYFGANFLSPNQNIRTDEFGGSFENRARYTKECVKASVKAIKFMHAEDRFVVGVRTSAEELMPGGLEMSDYVEIHKEAQRAGSSYASLSWGAGFENMKYLFPSEDMMPQKVAHAKYFSENLDMPVIVPSLHNPDIAAEVTDSYKNVLVGLGRQAYADPDWPNKVKEGKIQDITRCLRCNLDCYSWSRLLGLPERCAVNPELGFEGFNSDNWPKRRA